MVPKLIEEVSQTLNGSGSVDEMLRKGRYWWGEKETREKKPRLSRGRVLAWRGLKTDFLNPRAQGSANLHSTRCSS